MEFSKFSLEKFFRDFRSSEFLILLSRCHFGFYACKCNHVYHARDMLYESSWFFVFHDLSAGRLVNERESCWSACFSRMLFTNAGRISCKLVCVICGTRVDSENVRNFTLNPSSLIYKSHRIEVALLTQICGIRDRSL